MLLKNKDIWLLFIVFAVFIAGQTGIVNTYLPTFLQTSVETGGWGFTEQAAAMGLSVVTTIGLVANPAGGAITNRLPLKLKRIMPVLVAVIYLFCFYMMFQTENITLVSVSYTHLDVYKRQRITSTW